MPPLYTQMLHFLYSLYKEHKAKLDAHNQGCMDWIDVAQVRDQWSALVNTVLNHRVP
jgi:hypothetical protein